MSKLGKVLEARRVRAQEALATWLSLNETLRDATEEGATQLLEAELAGRCRWQYVLRCHARFNKMRGRRERQELRAKLVTPKK